MKNRVKTVWGTIFRFWIALLLVGGWINAGAITNATQGRGYDSLQKALAEAQSGDTLRLEAGVYRGNFLIDRPMKLIGADSAGRTVLDGEGKGTVVTIRARNVMLKNLRIRGSGDGNPPFSQWGDAGLLVRGEDTRLENLQIDYNAWGVILLKSSRCVLKKSIIRSNRKTGVLIMGGEGHAVDRNVIRNNRVGITVTKYFDKLPYRSATSPSLSPADIAHDVSLTHNIIRGNGNMGIMLGWYAHRIRIAKNRIILTGRETPKLSVSAGGGLPAETLKRLAASGIKVRHSTAEIEPGRMGSGIFLTCFVHHCRIADNNLSDNLGNGIDLFESDHCMMLGNRIEKNHDGLSLNNASHHNTFCCNTVKSNSRFGVVIDGFFLLRPRSGGNMLIRNDLFGNGSGDARDMAGAVYSRELLLWRLRETMPSASMADDRLLQGFLSRIRPAENSWDDGKYGNRYGDFDERREGFEDQNGDGIGEIPYRIPGGKSTDRHPLTREKVEELIRKGEEVF